MKLTAISLWKWHIRFWKRSVIPAFWSDRFEAGTRTQIRIIRSDAIDIEKWNKCLETNNARIYSSFEFLSGLCDKWDALIVDDYKAVLALPIRKKISFTSYYTPPFMQQLCIVGEVNQEEIKQVLQTLRTKSIVTHFTSEEKIRYSLNKATNFFIELNRPFNKTAGNFSPSFHKEYKRSLRYMHNYCAGDLSAVIELYRREYLQKCNLRNIDLTNFERTCTRFLSFQKCHTRYVESHNKILAAVILLEYRDRLYNLLNYISSDGRKQSANYRLYKNVLEEFSGRNYVFDFEGSDLPGVKSFYKKFNPKVEYYYKCRMTGFPLSLFFSE